MRLLGIDFGERKIGLAISEGWLAMPLSVERRTKDIEKKLQDLCQKEQIEKIVVGISEGTMAKKQEEFGERLAKASGLPVQFWDETLTTREALQKMIESGVRRKRRRWEDAVAASLILQSYLDNQKNK